MCEASRFLVCISACPFQYTENIKKTRFAGTKIKGSKHSDVVSGVQLCPQPFKYMLESSGISGCDLIWR